jgi:peptidoglycan-associated lipoprotein
MATKLAKEKRDMSTHRGWQLCLALFLFTFAGCAEQTAPTTPSATQPTPAPPPPAAAAQPAVPTPTPPPPPMATAPTPPPPAPKPSEPARAAGQEWVDEPALKDVFFDSGHTDIGRHGLVIMKSNAGWLTEHADRVVLIEGYTDYKGTQQENMAVSEKRAASAKDYLLKAGINEARIQTVSYGSDRPVCPQKTEACAAKNRRVHFMVKPQ